MRGRRLRALFREPPGATPSAARRRACDSSGTRAIEISAVVREASIISCAWPSRPNPVTSVTAWMSNPSIASTGARLSVHMTSTASSSAASDSVRFRSGPSAAPAAAESTRPARMVMPMPSGLVSTSASPGFAPALRVTFASSTTPVTDRPYSGMSWSIEWPPAMTAPASATFSAPPRRISSRTAPGRTFIGNATTARARIGRPRMA